MDDNLKKSMLAFRQLLDTINDVEIKEIIEQIDNLDNSSDSLSFKNYFDLIDFNFCNFYPDDNITKISSNYIESKNSTEENKTVNYHIELNNAANDYIINLSGGLIVNTIEDIYEHEFLAA
ncbi:hypothetical protein HX017_18275 [Myroides marinus]|uniref:hypothetical protein n=1 Tax=Myroides marinus TaxID=703342 RepID=UPI002578C5B3|nr:hypothetical protein [Myroides marinus]MDM1346523.1 hypothetical protein [Myroides marinus]MDM1352584.1 hypothetical protein [Myroides marinus]MDM1356104.1 hypothetical protein [Myroides marinus]MDM1359789.1 hypothetical protein [Myroides marinus]MDM1366868.1 hypothetical protein [Myroides marinus]